MKSANTTIRFALVLATSVLFVFTSTLSAADYSVVPASEGPPADALAPEIAKLLGEKGVTVKRGSRTLCDIWLCKELTVPSLKTGVNVIHPFQPGKLMGVVRYARRGRDFRDQQIGKGVYTLRYAHQPVDGAHVGTSDTRDFLLLLEAAKDKSAKMLDYKNLTKISTEAAQTAHPALLSLLRPAEEGKNIRHDEERDWWIIRLTCSVKVGDEKKELPLDLVVVGMAAE